MLTSHPHIVIARPPRRIRKSKPGPKIIRYIVGPNEPKTQPAAVTVKRKVAKPAAVVIVGRTPEPPPSPEEYKARGDAADALFQEIVRRVEASSTRPKAGKRPGT